MKTTENNKLLADFLVENEGGLIKLRENVYSTLDEFDMPDDDLISSDLKFNTDWNWLMQVVEKINNTGRFEVVIKYGFCYITDGLGELTLSFPEKNTMYAVYKAVVEFVKWYNQTK